MKDRPQSSALTRRQFVALVAAGSAATLASPLAAAAALAAPPARRRTTAGAAAAAIPAAESREFERQLKSTHDTLAVLRKHAMGPGTELALVFRPLKSTRRSG